MEPYRNIAGGSGVRTYEIGQDYIAIEFSDGAVYRYTYASAGQENVEHMKGLATSGQGLDEFLSTSLSKMYERKEK
ncbi:MAG: hypothetical protein ACM3MF_01150 [Anaerolineae bacterium]